RLGGQAEIGPSGVSAQSSSRISASISPPASVGVCVCTKTRFASCICLRYLSMHRIDTAGKLVGPGRRRAEDPRLRLQRPPSRPDFKTISEFASDIMIVADTAICFVVRSANPLQDADVRVACARQSDVSPIDLPGGT